MAKKKNASAAAAAGSSQSKDIQELKALNSHLVKEVAELRKLIEGVSSQLHSLTADRDITDRIHPDVFDRPLSSTPGQAEVRHNPQLQSLTADRDIPVIQGDVVGSPLSSTLGQAEARTQLVANGHISDGMEGDVVGRAVSSTLGEAETLSNAQLPDISDLIQGDVVGRPLSSTLGQAEARTGRVVSSTLGEAETLSNAQLPDISDLIQGDVVGRPLSSTLSQAEARTQLDSLTANGDISDRMEGDLVGRAVSSTLGEAEALSNAQLGSLIADPDISNLIEHDVGRNLHSTICQAEALSHKAQFDKAEQNATDALLREHDGEGSECSEKAKPQKTKTKNWIFYPIAFTAIFFISTAVVSLCKSSKFKK